MRGEEVIDQQRALFSMICTDLIFINKQINSTHFKYARSILLAHYNGN